MDRTNEIETLRARVAALEAALRDIDRRLDDNEAISASYAVVAALHGGTRALDAAVAAAVAADRAAIRARVEALPRRRANWRDESVDWEDDGDLYFRDDVLSAIDAAGGAP